MQEASKIQCALLSTNLEHMQRSDGGAYLVLGRLRLWARASQHGFVYCKKAYCKWPVGKYLDTDRTTDKAYRIQHPAWPTTGCCFFG